MKEIWFEQRITNTSIQPSREGVVYHKITKFNYHLHLDKIREAIKLFNSEIDWAGMWNEADMIDRLDDNHILYLLESGTKTIGFVWYDTNYLYNTYVSHTRTQGDSQDFINYTLHDLKTTYITIKLYCDDWNIRAQKFFKGIGFININ
jgi:hypothetical protein